MAKKNQEVRVTFRCTPEIADRIERVSEDIGLGLSGYIRMVLIEDMNRRDVEKKAQKQKEKAL